MKVEAKRRYGQHFLRDAGIIDRLIRVIDPSPEDTVLEIGAGEGVLTIRIAPLVGSLAAVEVDNDCIPLLKNNLREHPNVKIVHGDILKLSLSSIFADSRDRSPRFRAVGNLPYNIATPVIEKFLSTPADVEDMTFMVQLEVGQRIAASPGSKEYGFLSVFCQHLAEVDTRFKVPPECFVPRPRVMSVVITLHPRIRNSLPGFYESFVDVTKAAFGHRRKTIANSLRLSMLPAESVEGMLEAAGIAGERRAEDLTVEEYEHLAAELRSARGGERRPR
jgi:16S rRNA (adenine1518-N6/adenine1519-N6)-dimethyltransferase